MTEAEKNEIVGLVMTEISSQAVDFDIATEQPQANDLLTAVRQTSSGAYVGVTIKWDDVARIATEVANRAAERAEQAETDANNILERVQSKGTEITNFVATSKTEIETQKNESVNAVKSVYQTDLNELKGDLGELISVINIEKNNTSSFFDFVISTGDEIKVSNVTTGVNLWTRMTEEGTDVEELGYVAEGKEKIFVATGNANYIRAYFTGQGGARLENLSKRVPTLESKTENIEKDLNELIDRITNEKIMSCSQGSYYYNFNFIRGHEYTVLFDKGSANIYTRANDSSSENLDVIARGADAPFSTIFIPTVSTDTLYIYATEDMTLTIKDNSSIEQRLDVIESKGKTYKIDINGTGDYTTLRDGIAEAIKYSNSIVYVEKGTYDLLTEFSDLFSTVLTKQEGIKLQNDVHVIFSSGAVVTCLYTGSEADKDAYFSPFYSGTNGGFTLENLNIKASNVRYCVHDDQGRSTGMKVHKYLNCRFEWDNTNSPTGYYPECIGGGCSGQLEVIVDGCWFKSKKGETKVVDCLSYHNTSYISDAMTNIHVSNSYCADKGTFRFTHHGDSTNVSKAYVNNCSLGAEIITGHEVPSQTDKPENFEIISWNNEIRTN